MSAVEEHLARYTASLDAPDLAARYHADGGCVVLPSTLPLGLVERLAAEALALAPRGVRRHVPWVRKAGAVPHPVVAREAPSLHALHQSPALLALFSAVARVPLQHRAPGEVHASAIYDYARPGDHIAWHTDECGCPPGDSFSVLVGLVDQSSSALELETWRACADRPPLRQRVRTTPGTVVFLCGARAWHRVTPLGADERRVTFGFTYLRLGKAPGGLYKLRLDLGNRLLYFGPGPH
ncbi:MAG: hypothetical protein HY909_11400 [Deltaproteobacteria bacterium]|nr:hypothetical protein [Deltaproteobacteria bacterium]